MEGQGPAGWEPRLPAPGWLPDPARTDLERYWDGAGWTEFTRPRAGVPGWTPQPQAAQPPMSWQASAQTSSLQHWAHTPDLPVSAAKPRRRTLGLGGRLLLWALLAALIVVPAGYLGRLPLWVPWPTMLTAPVPTGPDVAYPVFGTEDLSLYLARAMVVQERSIDVTGYVSKVGGVPGIHDAMYEALAQNPYVFVSGWSVSYSAFRTTVVPDYIYADSEAERRRVATADAVATIVASPDVARAQGDYALASAIHDAVVAANDYDYAAVDEADRGYDSGTSAVVAQSQEAYGALVEGSSVCTGYAQAYELLADAVGLSSVIVTGDADNGESIAAHAWNKVLINGEWVLVDTTWDDVLAWGSSHSYFAVPDGDPSLTTRTADDYWVIDSHVGDYGVA
ncbi:DUF2510 domain-containing protein [Demequina capsici]|uniref:DUF2510 domain-containing protein n=1 Tax=Demequina capsici TaxID=3075620 RepID=A0AA96J9H4_9MICO|nr:DUF2510 domain-containing protein [Demequina sp. PMTSA13]WNM26400.1 DUF2510 domain-containing protein [Demequina sp. PMTSA13]